METVASALTLDAASTGQRLRIRSISGDTRFVSRITAIGLTEGCAVEVLQNVRSRPVLVFARDSTIAVDRDDCAHIGVEVAL
mgnify:CR=1 FL=1